MKKLLMCLMGITILCGCEKDTKTKALDILYNECLTSGDADEKWCRCIKADLKRKINDEMAYAVVQHRQHYLLPTTMFSARVICQCRLYPEEMAAHGIPCKEMNKNNPLKF